MYTVYCVVYYKPKSSFTSFCHRIFKENCYVSRIITCLLWLNSPSSFQMNTLIKMLTYFVPFSEFLSNKVLNSCSKSSTSGRLKVYVWSSWLYSSMAASSFTISSFSFSSSNKWATASTRKPSTPWSSQNCNTFCGTTWWNVKVKVFWMVCYFNIWRNRPPSSGFGRPLVGLLTVFSRPSLRLLNSEDWSNKLLSNFSKYLPVNIQEDLNLHQHHSQNLKSQHNAITYFSPSVISYLSSFWYIRFWVQTQFEVPKSI